MKHLEANPKQHKKRFAFSLLEILASVSLFSCICIGLLFSINILLKTWDQEAKKSLDRKDNSKNALDDSIQPYKGSGWEAVISKHDA